MPHFVVTYTGSTALAGQFVQLLETEGADVEWEPPKEQRSVDPVQAVLVVLAAKGTEAMFEAARTKFRERWPKAEIDWREDNAYR